jgi:hypothetical protein
MARRPMHGPRKGRQRTDDQLSATQGFLVFGPLLMLLFLVGLANLLMG